RPSARIAAGTSSALSSSRRAFTATAAPLRARAKAIAFPIPRLAPVTSATRLCRSSMALFLLLAFRINVAGSAKEDEGRNSHDRSFERQLPRPPNAVRRGAPLHDLQPRTARVRRPRRSEAPLFSQDHARESSTAKDQHDRLR